MGMPASAVMLFLLASQGARAQLVSFGIKAGAPLTDAVRGNFGGDSEASRYTAGLLLELRLPASFAFEADILYGRTGYRASQSDRSITTTGQVRANSWEVPLLVKYHLPVASEARPFVHGGYVIRRLSGVKGHVHIFGTSPDMGIPIDATFPVNASQALHEDPTHGIAAGAGLRLGGGRFHLSPEVRYTRWTGRPFDEQGPRGFFLQSSQNQVELLVGLSF